MRSSMAIVLLGMAGAAIGLADDPPEPNLLFHLSFNKRAVLADYARGNPDSPTFKESLELREVQGIDGAGFQSKEGERLDYEIKDNFDLRSGTISMWIQPVNWLPDNKRFEHFFVAQKQGEFNFVLYKYTQPPDLRVHLVVGNRKFNAGTSAEGWRPGNWYKVDVAWDNRALRIYVNGKMEGELTFPEDLVLPEVKEGAFTIAPLMYWKPPACSPDDRTIVDEIKIYDRPLTPGEIKDAYFTARNELEDDYRPPTLAIPQLKNPITPEDAWRGDEWSDAAQMPILAQSGNGLASDRSAQFFAKYDDASLYLAVISDKPTDLVANAKEGADNLAKDDTHEVVLYPTADAIYRFVFNRDKVLLDSKNGDKTWSGGVKLFSQETGRWTSHLVIPYAVLGLDPPKVGDRWRFNVARRWADTGTASSWAFSQKAEGSDLGTIVFGGKISAVRLTRLGELHRGEMDVVARFHPPDEKADRIDVLTQHLSDAGKLDGMRIEVESEQPRPRLYRYQHTFEKAQSGLLRMTAHSKIHKCELLDYSLLFYARPPIVIDMTPITQTNEIEIALDAHDAGKAWRERIKAGKVECKVVVEEESAGVRVLEKVVPIEGVRASYVFACPTLTPGQYMLTVNLIDAESKEKIRSAVHFTRPATPWVDAKAGIDDSVPKPWTPVEASGKSVKVLGREYVFASGPFPDRITSQGEAVLAQPIAFEIKTKDGEETLTCKEIHLVESKPDHATLQGVAESTALRMEWKSVIEFDGMLRCDFTLSPVNAPVEVADLALVIAAPNEHAKFVLTPYLEEWKDGKIELPFDRFVWLTGHRLGVCWFTESNVNWNNPGSPPPIQIARGDTATTLRLNIITAPTTIDKPIPYTMGIQATPAKPMPKDWRNFNFGGFGKVKYSHSQSICWGGGGLKQDAYLQPDDEDGFRESLKRYNDGKITPCPYSCPTYMASHNPVYNFYHSEWRNSEGHKFVGYVKGTLTYDLIAICPRSAYTDLLNWWIGEMSEHYPIGGIYFDCCSPEVCHNAYHGCGGRDAFGKRIIGAPIFALRESLKRVYKTLHKRNMILVNHAHSRFLPPCHSFSDYWYPGEQYTARLGQDIWYYTDQIPPEVWQSELNSYIKGVGITFLPEYGRGTPTKYRDEETKPSRSLLACCAVNDVPCSASWINDGEIEKLWGILDKFWVSDAEFIPHWAAGPVAADKPLIASAYKGRKSVLLIVANLTKEPARGAVKLDAKALGIPAEFKMTNEFTGEAISQPLDGIQIALPERDYTIISITW
ncbi:MAG: glycoside hydrolase domain-containing protein [Planctomycetota bacterium]